MMPAADGKESLESFDWPYDVFTSIWVMLGLRHVARFAHQQSQRGSHQGMPLVPLSRMSKVGRTKASIDRSYPQWMSSASSWAWM